MTSNKMIKSRYTTKTYDANYKIPNETIENIIEILRYSPSSINSQPWRFYSIQNKDLKLKLSEVSKHNKEKVQDCSLLIVFTALKLQEFLKQFEKYSSEGGKSYFEKNVKIKPDAEIEAWIKNQVYISLGFVLASLGFEGIDSTSLEGIEKEEYEKILNIDTSKECVLFALAIGKRDANDVNQPSVTPKSRIEKSVTVKEIL